MMFYQIDGVVECQKISVSRHFCVERYNGTAGTIIMYDQIMTSYNSIITFYKRFYLFTSMHYDTG
jgi:hypothetical protein